MNIYNIALFLFLIQFSMSLLTVTDSAGRSLIPLKCTDDYSACIYFSMATMGGTTISDVWQEQIDSGQYRSTELTTDVSADIYLATSFALTKVTDFIGWSLHGNFTLVTFFLGYSVVSVLIASLLQGMVYYFYGKWIWDTARGQSTAGDING